MSEVSTDADNPSAHIQRQSTAALTLAAIGVVYGDIGTSPLYAFRVAINAATESTPGDLPRETVLGVVSLILWALFIIVTLKYVLILLRADNNGEGGTLTLMALASRSWASAARRCSMATRSSRRRCRCCPPSRVSTSPRRPSMPMWCRSRL